MIFVDASIFIVMLSWTYDFILNMNHLWIFKFPVQHLQGKNRGTVSSWTSQFLDLSWQYIWTHILMQHVNTWTVFYYILDICIDQFYIYIYIVEDIHSTYYTYWPVTITCTFLLTSRISWQEYSNDIVSGCIGKPPTSMGVYIYVVSMYHASAHI